MASSNLIRGESSQRIFLSAGTHLISKGYIMQAQSNSARNTKRVVGVIAILLIAVFAVLFLIFYHDLILFLILALVTSFLANLVFRRIDRQKL
jgi:hypothetical protein